MLSEREQEQQLKEGEAGPCIGVGEFEGTGLTPAAKAHHRRQYPAHIVITHEESKTSHQCGGSSVVLFLAGDRSRGGKRRGGCVGVRRRGPDSYTGDIGYTGTEELAAGDGIAGMRQIGGRQRRQ